MVRFLQNVSVTSLAVLLEAEFSKVAHASGSASKSKESADSIAVDSEHADGLHPTSPSQRHKGLIIVGEI
jgi:hypothetical protein